ncbi:MAG: hypothetical protein LBK83_04980 [Treponema sp.]|nr:hypothetical protein [Treponema sp.]
MLGACFCFILSHHRNLLVLTIRGGDEEVIRMSDLTLEQVLERTGLIAK